MQGMWGAHPCNPWRLGELVSPVSQAIPSLTSLFANNDRAQRCLPGSDALLSNTPRTAESHGSSKSVTATRSHAKAFSSEIPHGSSFAGTPCKLCRVPPPANPWRLGELVSPVIQAVPSLTSLFANNDRAQRYLPGSDALLSNTPRDSRKPAESHGLPAKERRTGPGTQPAVD